MEQGINLRKSKFDPVSFGNTLRLTEEHRTLSFFFCIMNEELIGLSYIKICLVPILTKAERKTAQKLYSLEVVSTVYPKGKMSGHVYYRRVCCDINWVPVNGD